MFSVFSFVFDEKFFTWAFFHRETVSDLNKGAEYFFRVRAKNLVGAGEPTQTLHSIVAKDDIVKPDVDLHNLYMGSISAKAGTNLKLDLLVIGKITSLLLHLYLL